MSKHKEVEKEDVVPEWEGGNKNRCSITMDVLKKQHASNDELNWCAIRIAKRIRNLQKQKNAKDRWNARKEVMLGLLMTREKRVKELVN